MDAPETPEPTDANSERPAADLGEAAQPEHSQSAKIEAKDQPSVDEAAETEPSATPKAHRLARALESVKVFHKTVAEEAEKRHRAEQATPEEAPEPTHAFWETGQGKRLVTLGPVTGRDQEGRRYYWIPELKRSVLESELTRGAFQPEDADVETPKPEAEVETPETEAEPAVDEAESAETATIATEEGEPEAADTSETTPPSGDAVIAEDLKDDPFLIARLYKLGIKPDKADEIERLVRARTDEASLKTELESQGLNTEAVEDILNYTRQKATDRERERQHQEGELALASDNGIPAEVVRSAAEHGLTVEYLIHAMDSPAAGEYLRSLGIEWGAPKPEAESLEPEPPEVIHERENDPRIKIVRQGYTARKRVAQIKEDLEEELKDRKYKLWSPLRGKIKPISIRIPLIGINFPILSAARRLYVASRMYNHERKDRKAENRQRRANNESPLAEDFGLFGLRWRKKMLDRVKTYDKKAAVVRSDLRWWNRQPLKQIDEERQRTAETINYLEKQRHAYVDLHQLLPEDHYEHWPWKKREFQPFEPKLTLKRTGKYDPYIETPQETPEVQEM